MIKVPPTPNGSTPNRQLLTPGAGATSTFSSTLGSTAGDVADEVTITRNSEGKLAVKADGVDTAHIADGAVETDQIADNAVTSAKIADGAIVDADVNATAAIAYSKLALTNSIVAGDLTTGSVTNVKIDDGAVTFSKLADDAVVFGKVAEDAIDTDNILDGAVTPAKIGTVTLSDTAAPTVDSADIDEQLGYLANRIKTITGEAGWKDAPDTTIAAIATALATSVNDGDAAGGDLSGTYPNPSVIKASGPFQLTGDVTPAALTANVNDYNPTGLSGATALLLATDGDPYTISGLAGGSDGRLMLIYNIDAAGYVVTLLDEDTGSTAANRFALTSPLTLYPGECVLLRYNSGTSRWHLIGERGVQVQSDGGGDTGVTRILNFVSSSSVAAALGTLTDGVQTATFTVVAPTTVEIDAGDFPYTMSAVIERYRVNETAGTGALAFTAPPSADCQDGQRWKMMDIAGYAATRNLTVIRNTAGAGTDTINGATTALPVASLAYAGAELEYIGGGRFHLHRFTA